MNPELHSTPAEVRAAAAAWARQCAEGLSAPQRAEFVAWMRADPLHRRAFAQANRGGVDCDWAWQAGATEEIMAGLADRAVRRRRRRAAAGAGVALALGLGTLGWMWRANQSAAPAVASTPGSHLIVIRPAKQVLPDGSVVELMDGAEISTDFSGAQRAVSLVRGTAHFAVAKDPRRPFVVQAAGLAVQAVGTAFTVGLAERELSVLVTEGQVRVDAAAAATQATGARTPEPLASLGAGKAVELPIAAPIVAPPVVRAVGEAELHERSVWRIPKLEFTAAPLREVVRRMNEHNVRQFVLGDESVGGRRISGILRADKMDTLTETLEADFGVRAERSPKQIVLRDAR